MVNLREAKVALTLCNYCGSICMARRQNEILDALKALGLTEYESKVYLALLRQGHSTVREVAEASGVPRPKVYETLERLVTACLAVVHTTDPLSYVPLPLDVLLGELESRGGQEFQRVLQHLREKSQTQSWI